jgi:hypothetical protein
MDSVRWEYVVSHRPTVGGRERNVHHSREDVASASAEMKFGEDMRAPVTSTNLVPLVCVVTLFLFIFISYM